MDFFENKNDFKYLKYWIPIMVVGSVLMVFGLIKITDNIFEEYPLLKRNESLNTTIVGLDKYKGTTLVILKDSVKKSIRAFNWDLTPSPLYYHLAKGDSISCKPSSQKLFLIKKDGNVIRFEVQYLE